MTLWLSVLHILVMVDISSHLPQTEVAYELLFHTPNHWIYLYTLNFSYLFLIILIAFYAFGFHLYLPGLSALWFLYMLRENIPPYGYFRPADGQFRLVALLSYTTKQLFPSYFLHNIHACIYLWLTPFQSTFLDGRALILYTCTVPVHTFIHTLFQW